MSNDLQRSHRDRLFIGPIKLACVISTLGLMLATPASAQNEMMRGGGRTDSAPAPNSGQMERGNRGGIGTGDAIGLGIGIGGAIIQEMNKPSPPASSQNAKDGESRKAKGAGKDETNARDRKLPKGRKPPNVEPDEVTFVGKPEQVLHNPKHRVGKLGDLRDHKQVVIQKDGHYFKRHYYYTRLGGRPTWYWYDEPVPDKDRLTSTFQDAPICEEEGDDCDEQPPTKIPAINIGQPGTNVAPPNVPIANACPDCAAIRKLIADLEAKTAKDQDTRDNFVKYHLADESVSRNLSKAYMRVLDEKLVDDGAERKKLAAQLLECAKKCPAPPVAVAPPPVINVENPPGTPATPTAPPGSRPPNTCSIVEGTGQELETTDEFNCHGRKGKITVAKDVTVRPIPSAPKLAKTRAEGKPEGALSEPLDKQFSIKYSGTSCDNCRWVQFFWEEDLVKSREEDEFQNITDDPESFLSSNSDKSWRVDAVSPATEATYISFGANPEVFKNPAYCIEKYALGLREECGPNNKDGTEQIFDRPRPGTSTVFGRIARHNYGDDFAHADVVRIKYVIHFETFLVCGPGDGPKDVCAKVCWKGTFEWHNGLGILDADPNKWERTYELEKNAGCGKDGHIQTEGNIGLNAPQKTALSTRYPDYKQPK